MLQQSSSIAAPPRGGCISSTILSCAGCGFQALVPRLNWLPERILEFVEKKEADVVE